MGKLFAMTSHKGGTGRSTTTANIAFRLALPGSSVCIVDFDLASPTMGSILGMSGYETGGDSGVHDLLPKDSGSGVPLAPAKAAEEAIGLCRPVVRYARAEIRRPLADAGARLDLLPGKECERQVVENFRHIRDRFDPVLANLLDVYDVVFVDVRSGRDAPFHALFESEMPISWVVFYRWTPQHIRGAAELIDDLRRKGREVKAVRTAYLPPRAFVKDPERMSDADRTRLSFFRNQEQEIEQLRDRLFGDDPTVGTIGRDDVLLWREGVLVSEGQFDIDSLSSTTIENYRGLLDELLPGVPVA